MPKRVIDFDALWASDKLAACAEWAQSEYAWLYGLADASGSFEMTNLRVIWGRVAAIRKSLTLERLQQIFDEFIARGLLFTWEENGKRYGHWTGSDVPGRLPAPSWRMRLEKLAPPVPSQGLAAYSARFGGSKEGIVTRRGEAASARAADLPDPQACGRRHKLERAQVRLKPGLEETQGQDGDLYSGLDLKEDLEKEETECPLPKCSENRPAAKTSYSSAQELQLGHTRRERVPREIAYAACTPEEMLEIYEEDRGELPPAGALTDARRARCARLLAGRLTAEEFRAAVRLAAATPFLAGDGNRGWQANFDWLIANRGNVRKVLAGEYAPRLRARATKSRREQAGLSDLYTGMGPRAADCGVRVNPAALERIRARETQRARIDSARLAGAPAKHAAHAAACGGDAADAFGAPDGARAASVAEGAPPRASELVPETLAFDAPARASPGAIK